MLKTISLGKLISLPKLKMKKQERVFDKEWKMYFPSEEERQEFRVAIERAEKNITLRNIEKIAIALKTDIKSFF